MGGRRSGARFRGINAERAAIWSQTIRRSMDGVVTSEGVAGSIYGCNARHCEGDSAAIVQDDIEALRMKRGAVRPRNVVNRDMGQRQDIRCHRNLEVAKSANSTNQKLRPTI